MAEGFLEEIYKEAKLFYRLKQMVEYARTYDEHHVIIYCREILPELYDVCQRYLEQDDANGIRLWNQVQKMQETCDLILLGDIIEHDILPLLEGRMRQWGVVQTENQEGDFRFESTVSGFLTMKDLRSGTYIHSTVDPMWEARKLAEYIFNPRKAEYSVLGCGLGYLVYQLYDISHGSVRINVFEKDARVAAYARSYGVLDWIPEDVLNVVVDADPLPFLYSAEDKNVEYYIFKPELYNEPDQARLLLEEIDIQYSTGKRFQRNEEINLWSNFRRGCRWIAEFDTFSLHKEFIIAAAGPSLDDNMEFLRKNQGKKTLIAVGTVFRKLIESGIVPDMVVILDSQARTYRQIEGLEEQKVPMLLAMTAYWKFAAAYQGDKYLIPMDNLDESIVGSVLKGMDVWECVGTVTALGIEAAARFGAEKIFLVGVDLAYPGGVTHASGTMDRTTKSLDGMIPIDGMGDTTVYTDRVFLSYIQWIEDWIARTPHISYYNMSHIGAKIKGAESVI